MDRDEVLKRSRAAKEDEGTAYADDRGRRYGAVAFSTVFIVIVVFDLFTDQLSFAPFSLFWAYVAAESLGRFQIRKTKKLIAVTVFAAAASLGFLVCYILNVLKVGA